MVDEPRDVLSDLDRGPVDGEGDRGVLLRLADVEVAAGAVETLTRDTRQLGVDLDVGPPGVGRSAGGRRPRGW